MGSIQKRPNGKWRARYTDPTGAERAQHFDTKAAAQEFLARQVVKVSDGSWIDPLRGKRTVRDYAEQWQASQLHHRPLTKVATSTRMKHVLDRFGDSPIAHVQRSDVQAWVASLEMAPSTVEGIYRQLATLYAAAIEDRVVSQTPCRKIHLPEQDDKRVVIPTTDEIAKLYRVVPDREKAMILLASATGVRISEMCGLTVDRVDFLRRQVVIDRQIVGRSGTAPRFGPPKTRASNRILPVPQSVLDDLAAHLVQHPAADVVFRTTRGTPWVRNALDERMRHWCGKAKVSFTWHGFRHHYASALIAAGQSVKVVQARLGHASALLTLDTYGHLWPDDEDATRGAVDELVLSVRRTPDGLLARKSRSGA
jgi:integrase